MKIGVIAVLVLGLLIGGFFAAPGPQPHIVIPGDELTTIGPLTITSTLLSAWFAMVVIIGVAFLLTRGMSLIPGKGQNFIEAIVGFLADQVEELAGKDNARRFFPVIATFFLFIIVSNWLALLPFFKTVGLTHDYGWEVFHKLQVQSEKGVPFTEPKHVFAWRMEDAGGIGVVMPGSRDVFEFEIHEGDDPGKVLDHYILALAAFYTDFEAPAEEHAAVDEGHGESHGATAEEKKLVADALTALNADPKAPKFHTAGHAQLPGNTQARMSSEAGVTSAALGETFTSLEFPGDKVAMVYPFFRAAFSDLNNTLALAIVAFFMIEFWGFRALGAGYLGKFFISPLKSPIMTFVGLLELLSEFIRIISFSFRLFGNIFAGGVLILILTYLAPFLAPLPIYGLELFVGLIQAIVFSLLVLVFAVGAVEHHGDEEHHDEGHHGEDAEGDPHHMVAAQAH